MYKMSKVRKERLGEAVEKLLLANLTPAQFEQAVTHCYGTISNNKENWVLESITPLWNSYGEKGVALLFNDINSNDEYEVSYSESGALIIR